MMANTTSQDPIDEFSAGVSLAVTSVLSLASNLLLVVVIANKRRSSVFRSAEKLLTLYSCLEGAYTSIPAVLSAVAYLSQWSVDTNEVVCDFHGWLAFATKSACAFVVTVLLFGRYLEQSRRHRFSRRTSKRLLYVSVCGVLVSCLLAAVPLMGGHKMASFEPTGSYCHFDHRQTTNLLRGFSISVVVAAYIILQTTLFCYVSILCHRERNKNGDSARAGERNASCNDFHSRQKANKPRPSHLGLEGHGHLNRELDWGGFSREKRGQGNISWNESRHFDIMVLVLVTVLWFCFLPFLIVVILAQTGFTILPQVDFAAVRILSLEGALNPVVALVIFPPYRTKSLRILTCGRRCVGEGRRHHNRGLYEAESKRVGLTQSVVYDDSILQEAPTWYLVKPNRSFSRSYSTGDLTSRSLENLTGSNPHPNSKQHSSIRSILQPSKSSETLSSDRRWQKPRRSIHWEDGVSMAQGVVKDRSRVILVRRESDGVKTGVDSLCYIDNDESCSSETESSYSDEWTSESDRDVDCEQGESHLPVYIIDGRVYYTHPTSHRDEGSNQCVHCNFKTEHQTGMKSCLPAWSEPRRDSLRVGRIRGRAEQRTGSLPRTGTGTVILADGKELYTSPYQKSRKPRVLRKQVERQRRMRQNEMEPPHLRHLTAKSEDGNGSLDEAGISREELAQLQYLSNINPGANMDSPDTGALNGKTVSNGTAESTCNQHDAGNFVNSSISSQNGDHIEIAVNVNQHNPLPQNVSSGCQPTGLRECLFSPYHQSRTAKEVATNLVPKVDMTEVASPVHPLPVEAADASTDVHRKADKKINPETIAPSSRPLNDENGLEPHGSSNVSEFLGRGMESLKHLEMHCEHLLQRSLSFRETEPNGCDGTVTSKEHGGSNPQTPAKGENCSLIEKESVSQGRVSSEKLILGPAARNESQTNMEGIGTPSTVTSTENVLLDTRPKQDLVEVAIPKELETRVNGISIDVNQNCEFKLDTGSKKRNDKTTLGVEPPDSNEETKHKNQSIFDIQTTGKSSKRDAAILPTGHDEKLANTPVEKDIVFHGLTSEDPHVINILFQKVMRQDNSKKDDPPRNVDVESEVRGKLDDGRIKVEPETLNETNRRHQEEQRKEENGMHLKNKMAGGLANEKSSNCQPTVTTSHVDEHDHHQGQGGEVSPTSGDIPYRHFLRTINITPNKKQQQQIAIPSISVTPSDNNDVIWASESEESLGSESSVESLFCKPPMLKLGSKRRKGKNNLTIPYWLNSGNSDSVNGEDRNIIGGGATSTHHGRTEADQNPRNEDLLSDKTDGISVRYFEYDEPDTRNLKKELEVDQNVEQDLRLKLELQEPERNDQILKKLPVMDKSNCRAGNQTFDRRQSLPAMDSFIISDLQESGCNVSKDYKGELPENPPPKLPEGRRVSLPPHMFSGIPKKVYAKSEIL